MKYLSIAYRFSRPHTIIGSTLSTLALYFMAAFPIQWPSEQYEVLIWTLLSAVACNLYIVGLNQLTDIEIDRQNKPHLPLASGEMSASTARWIISLSGILTLLFGLIAGYTMLALVVVVGALGTAYSLPPLKLKKNHFFAALSITLVRGVLVNILMFLHFRWELWSEWGLPSFMWPLILLMILFSVGIAWFKDIPDVEGDQNHDIATVAVKRGVRWAFRGAISLASLAYLTLILWAGIGLKSYNTDLMAVWHALALLLFWLVAYTTNPFKKASVTRFYRAYWVLFFLEYIIYPLGLL